MSILIFLGVPVLVCVVLMMLSRPHVLETEEDLKRLQNLDQEEPPRFARDYAGRVWVDKRQKGFFRTIRRRSSTPPGQQEQ